MNFAKTTGKTIATAFLDFDQRNPQIYRLFKKQALNAILKGRSKISAKQIIGWVRWEHFIITDNDHGFKINDAFTAHYARKFTKEFPQHQDKFELRRLRSL